MSIIECLTSHDPTKVVDEDLKIPNRICFFLHGILSKEECKNIIEATDKGFQSSFSNYPNTYRNNLRQVVDDHKLAKILFDRIKMYIPETVYWKNTEISIEKDKDSSEFIVESLNERFRICKYLENQFFRYHQDGEYWRNENIQSKLTFMVYLNEEFQGGNTHFLSRPGDSSEIILNLKPRTGSLIVFEHSLWHEGQILKGGMKYILRSDILYKNQVKLLNEKFDQKISSNFIENMTQLKGHYGYIWSLIQLKNGFLASASRDKTIKLWNLENGKCEKTLIGHTHSVLCLIENKEEYLISGSRDYNIKVWKDEICLKTLQGHQGNVLSLIELSNGFLCSGSSDKTIKIWKDFNLYNTLTGHEDWIWCLHKFNGYLLSGSEDQTIKVWNENFECIQTLKGHSGAINSIISLSSDEIISGSSDKTIRIWKWKNCEFHCTQSWKAHDGYVKCLLKVNQEIIISGSEDNTIKVWKISKDNTELIQILTLKNYITSLLLLGSNKFASGSYDSNIHLWNHK